MIEKKGRIYHLGEKNKKIAKTSVEIARVIQVGQQVKEKEEKNSD